MSGIDAKPRSWGWLLLLTTSGTLVCCALPALLVALGFGSVLAALVSNAPWLIVLSQHKAWVFAVSGMLLLLACWVSWRPGRVCPADPVLAAACERVLRWNRGLFLVSAVAWLIGFLVAYLLPWVLMT